jgi:hypothetical protein
MRDQFVEGAAGGDERGLKAFAVAHFVERPAAAVLGKNQTQITRGLIQLERGFWQRGVILARLHRFEPRIARQFKQLASGNRFAEEQPGSFRQLVRLVENHRVAGR